MLYFCLEIILFCNHGECRLKNHLSFPHDGVIRRARISGEEGYEEGHSEAVRGPLMATVSGKS